MSPAQGKRRALGQHFLRDRSVCMKIAQTIREEARKTGCLSLLEIGPGLGAITDPILDGLRADGKAAIPFLLCERDRDLATKWQGRAEAFRDQGVPLEVDSADFLDLPPERFLAHPPVGIVSNLPYSSGTAILTRLAEHSERIPVMVLMFQAEVAQRLRASPNTKSWGSLSIWIQNRWDVEKLLSVPPGAFAPPPDVDSEVVVLRRRESPRVQVDSARNENAEALWNGLLRSAFAHRRKMLRSGLQPGSSYRNALDAASLDGTKRAEALTWEEWSRFYAALLRNPT
jgi:16S rRNA (adenine1518-N6/adenine1519-N6)-dimethyltransferase